MIKEDIHLTDWQRILMGNAPFGFLLEVLVRSLFIYTVLLVVIRLMGKRMSGQLTIAEMAIMLALGAIISVPMQAPDRGLLQGVLLLFLFLALERGLAYWNFKSKKVEEFTQGKISMLIKDGIIQVEQMEDSNISQEQLFAVLRSKEVYHLGKVKRMYQEATGDFSVYEREQPVPGLSLLPEQDKSIHQREQPAGNGLLACCRCGNVQKDHQAQKCQVCGNDSWMPAVVEK